MHHIVSTVRHRRNPHAAIAAWLVTGPLGHLYAGVADWVGVLVRLARARGDWSRL